MRAHENRSVCCIHVEAAHAFIPLHVFKQISHPMNVVQALRDRWAEVVKRHLKLQPEIML